MLNNTVWIETHRVQRGGGRDLLDAARLADETVY